MGIISHAGDNVSEFAWKWRCKIAPPKEGSNRTLKEIDSFNSSSSEVKKPVEVAPTTLMKVRHWYEGPKSFPCDDTWDWKDYPPKSMSESVAKSLEEYTIAVYKIKDKGKTAVGSRYPLMGHQVFIHERLLVEAVAPIFKKFGTHVNVEQSIKVKAPFVPLYLGMPDFLALHKATPDDTALKRLLEILIKVLDDLFFTIKKEVRSLRAQGLINFEHAWTYFPAGTIVYTYGRNSEMLSEVVEYGPPSTQELKLVVKVLTFDGSGFVWRRTTLSIPAFRGNIPITELSHYPLEFHADPASVRRQLTERGKRVLDLQGLHYQMYDGIAQEPDQGAAHNVEGRILIDVVGYNKYHLAQGKREGEDPDTVRNAATTRVGVRNGDPAGDDKATLKRLSDEAQARNKEEMLEKGDTLMFVGPFIEGYALKNKLWLSFYVEDILPMVWNDTAFDHLVYDEQQKDLVMSFVEHHGKKQQAFDDVIIGKGQGLVMLLSGPPGTGKTLTAEAVADKTHRPLFYLQAEDLGISAATLGANIKRLFAMAIDWQAVVLLDEADVFMAERNPNDIARNELVSIFLRELEYFRGIVFLTTNLYHTIDSAFKSRVNLHLLFKPLAADARRAVWRKFLGRLPTEEGQVETDVGEEDTRELALWRMNGREIKNAVKMAQLWCDHKGYTLTLERVENAIKATSPHVSKEGEHDTSLYD